MRFGGWLACGLVCGGIVVALGGCVSIDKYQRLEAAHRKVLAANERTATDLFDERSITGSLRARADSLERERATNNELLANYRTENDLLSEMLDTTRAELDRLAGMQKLDDVPITGAKLPKDLDAALKAFAQAHPRAVVYDAANGTVRWKSDLLFGIGSDVVAESSRAALREFCGVLNSQAAAGFEVLIVGHTDAKTLTEATKAKYATNWHLSAFRAIAVSNVLLHSGYKPQRISVAGCGEYRPVASNATEAGATQNRRVEVFLIPVGTVIPGATHLG